MPENSFKNNLPWTEEHDAFCYQHHIPPAAKILWQWLMRQGQIAAEIEPDLSEFNAWVAKTRGKPYSHNYLKKIFEILVSSRVLQVIKQYSWKITKLLVRPLSWLNPPKKRREKKLHNHNSSYNSQPSNGISAEQGVNSSSNSITLTTAEFEELERQHEILIACAEYEIYFDPNKRATRHLLEFDISDVRLALKHFVKRGGHQKIPDSQAWLISCLRECYWADKSLNLSAFMQLLNSWFPSNLPRDY
ncbi:hypothetical protein [Nostoc sp. UHCC 0252]|uniref:hypothetical protein n=1 Tax=Nostoc sp. UHCC 0252 TaxID=3110241 RepID=UPI002B206BBF|nr:hypothetical protein [Nostoc sp. UHCC 0252]MEA5601064.1 hypothetical protein [Nostoc sp. UHCC 0252]